jgi:quercetin dioxygenase-like cupin family protein
MAEPDIAFTTINTNNSERFQTLRRELGVTGFGINAITLTARQRGRIHSHVNQEEVFLVLEGELTIGVEGAEHAVPRGGLVRVGPGVRRQLVNKGSSSLLVLALGAHGEHVGRDGRAWESWDEEGDGRPPQEVPLPADLPV